MSAPREITLKPAPRFVFYMGRRATPELMAQSLRGLAMLLRVGGGEADALDEVGAQYRKYNVGRSYSRAADAMRQQGATFQQALLNEEVFPRAVREMVRSTPRASMMHVSLSSAAKIVLDGQHIKRELRSALIQPVFMLLVSIAFMYIAALVIIPGVVNSFSVIGGKTPESATVVLNVAGVATWVLGILIAVIVIALGYWFLFGIHRQKTRAFVDRQMIKLPFIGPIVQLAASGRLLQMLAVSLASGKSEPAALESAGAGCGNDALAMHCMSYARRMRTSGARLRDFADTPLIPTSARFMLASAPSVTQEIASMNELAPEFRAEANQRLESLTKMIAPTMNLLIYIPVGLLILAVVFSMYSIFPALIDVGGTGNPGIPSNLLK